jgi:cytochrome d ubiquinol oxidase subunit II
MEFDLPLLWAGIIAFGVLMYVVLDGFDLGIGLLFPLLPERRARDTMMNSVAPVWDGNETWLVLGGAGLFGAFPLAYAVILPALYLPLTLMLVGLIFRGVAFEFRFKAGDRGRRWWDLAFAAGSGLASAMQGVALGAFIQGFEVENRAYAGGPFDWLTPFSVFVGVALCLGYALLGAAWLVMKTEGELQGRVWRLLWPLTFLVLAAVGGVSLWTPFLNPAIEARWFTWPNLLYLSPVPILVGVLALFLLRAEARRRERQPFLLALALFVLAYVGLGISLWPHIIPPEIDIWTAAAPEESQQFLIVGVVPMVFIILGYTAYSYWVFRGKVAGEGYH